MKMKKNLSITVSETAASYLAFLREERDINISRFVARLIEDAAADDGGYGWGDQQGSPCGCQFEPERG